MSEFRDQIPGIIDKLRMIYTERSSDVYNIGVSVTYLTYLYDLLEKEEVKQIKERMVTHIGNGQYQKTFQESDEDDSKNYDPYVVYEDICIGITKLVEDHMKNLTTDGKYIVIEKLSEQFRFWNVLGD